MFCNLYLTLRVSGLGNCCCFMASTDILAHHFKRYMYLASALAVSGIYVGIISFPIIIESLIEELGIHKALAINGAIASIHLIGAVCYQSKKANTDNSIEPTCIIEKDLIVESTEHHPPLQRKDVRENVNGTILKEQPSLAHQPHEGVDQMCSGGVGEQRSLKSKFHELAQSGRVCLYMNQSDQY